MTPVQRLRTVTLALLVLLGLGGLFGGLAFVTDSSGGRLGMTVDELPKWPLLGSYTVPGILLVLLFGVLPLVAARHVSRHEPSGWSWTTAVGLLLVGWMGIQIGAIGLSLPVMQTALLIVGILLTGLGLDGGALSGADEYRRARRSYPHAEEDARPRPAGSRGVPDRGRRPRRPADRSDSLY
jgi:hypothetical protein